MSGYKILFINPPLTARQRYGALAQAGSVEPPLGLAYLAASARAAGFSPAILDCQALNLDCAACIEAVASFAPDAVGITLTTVLFSSAVHCAQAIQRALPGTRIIAGGPHFNALPRLTMERFPCFDVGVRGEGEVTIVELLRALSSGAPLLSVPGLVLRGEDGFARETAPRPRIDELDRLPLPAFDLLPPLNRYYRATTQSLRYLPTTSLVTSRGCPGQCLFCDRRTFGNTVRMHSAGYVAEMMEKLRLDFGVRGVIFEDDNFMLSPARLEELSSILNKRKLRLAWSALSRVDTITEEKLRIAKSCGCWQILFGIESGCQRILDFYKKGISIRQVRDAVKMTKARGLAVKGLFIVGNPGETVQSLADTREIIMNNDFDDVSLTYFTPYPGAEVINGLGSFGRCVKGWDGFTCFEPVFLPVGLTQGYLEQLHRAILSGFYSRPRVIRAYLLRMRSFGVMREMFTSWLALRRYTRGQREARVMLNADDFGLDEQRTRTTAELIGEGIVRGVSIMPTGRSFAEAAESIRGRKDLSVGVHLALLETRPVSSGVSSLTGADGAFFPGCAGFLFRYFTGRIRPDHLRAELRAQVLKAEAAGLEISRLDMHRHLHLVPGITRIVAELASEFGIGTIRLPLVPFDRRFLTGKAPFHRKILQLLFNIFCLWHKAFLSGKAIDIFSCSFGFAETGCLTVDHLAGFAVSCKSGANEIFCHPGSWDDAAQLRLFYSRESKARGLPSSDELARLYRGCSAFTRAHVRLRLMSCPFAALEAMIPKQGYIVDFGCGHGVFSHILSLASKEREIVGIDISESKIRAAVSSSGRDRIRFSLAADIGETLRKADCVIAADVLCYLRKKERDELLALFYRALKPGKLLVIKDIARSRSLKFAWLYFQEFIAVRLLGITAAGGLNFFTPEEMSATLIGIGFRVRTVNLERGYIFPHIAFVCEKT